MRFLAALGFCTRKSADNEVYVASRNKRGIISELKIENWKIGNFGRVQSFEIEVTNDIYSA